MTKKIIKILLVEDNPGDVLLLQETLAESLDPKFEIHPVELLAQALTAVDQDHFDVVLLDLSLPDISGWEVLNEIKPLKIPVILVTAHDWLQQLDVNGQNALSIYMRRPLARYELPPILKNLLETIHPKYPPHLNGLTPPTKPSA